MTKKPVPTLPVALTCALLAPASFAEVVTLTADRDNSIFSESGDLSNGSGTFLFTGKTLQRLGTDLRRALVRFDVASMVPAGSTINSATIRLRVSKTRPGNRLCSFHRLLGDWGEGASDASGAEGRGIAAATSDATWTHQFFDTSTWLTLGGDFDPTASARTSVGNLGIYAWTSEQLAADVQEMVNSPDDNFGWILIGDEGTLGSAKRFDSRHSSIAANRPQLEIDFTLPSPTEFAVTNTNPPHAALDVSPGTDLEVTFDGTVDASTITPATYRVWGRQTGFKEGAFSSGTFDPLLDFKAGEEVHLMLNRGIQSDQAAPLTPHLSQFTVAAGGGEQFLLSPVQMLGNANSFDLGLGDLDGDGDLDALVANNGSGNSVWINDGSGSFSDSGLTLGSSNSLNVALGDLDRDGDLDAFVGNDDGPNTVWLNDGTGQFTDAGQALGGDRSFGVDLGDLDGDGDLDAFVSNNGAPNKVWVNDGSGLFTDSGQTLGNAGSRHCALGDLDGDGDLDAFAAVSGEGDEVWINDGAGLFSAGQSLGSAASFGVALADLDGDGDFDAFVSTVSGSGHLVWTNDGSGSFSDSGQLLGTEVSRAVELGDVDGDGDLDAWVINNAPAANRIWTNDGNGTFADSGVSFGNSTHRDLALGDLDGDGDLDVFLANQNNPNGVFLNFHSGESADFDGDSLPNNVEVELGLDPADPADAAEDLDGDGSSNLEEFVAGTNLSDPLSRFFLTEVVVDESTQIFFTSSAERVYTLQSSATLQSDSWVDVDGQVTISGTGSVMMLVDSRPIISARYYRVVVSIP